MTVEEFNNLDEEQKKAAIFDAKKVTERFDPVMKYELFQIDNFFIETRISLQNKFRRVIATFSSKEVPNVYAGKVNISFHRLLYCRRTINAGCEVSKELHANWFIQEFKKGLDRNPAPFLSNIL